jgi:hypothetical protein
MIPSFASADGGFPIFSAFLLVLVYVFFAYCLSLIAKKTEQTERAWWAWIPIMQVLLILRSAKLEWWWIFLFLIPFVNIAVAIYVWVRIAKALGKHAIWGVLMVVPAIDLFVLAYLAFSKPGNQLTA